MLHQAKINLENAEIVNHAQEWLAISFVMPILLINAFHFLTFRKILRIFRTLNLLFLHVSFHFCLCFSKRFSQEFLFTVYLIHHVMVISFIYIIKDPIYIVFAEEGSM